MKLLTSASKKTKEENVTKNVKENYANVKRT